MAEGVDGPVDEIFFEGLFCEAVVAVDGEFYSGLTRGAEVECVVEGDGLEDGAELVVVVGALADDVEAEVDFGEGGEVDFGHGEIVYTWRVIDVDVLDRSGSSFWFGRVSSEHPPSANRGLGTPEDLQIGRDCRFGVG